MKSFIVVAALLVAASALPRSHKPNPFIINGEEATPHSIPYQVWLTITGDEGSWLCGGSLISQNYVLTAGHCADGASSGTVLLGAHDTTKKEDTQKTAKIAKFILHPTFDIDLIRDDIALLKLASPVELTEAIGLATLPKKSDASNTYAGEIARVSGWGLTDGFAWDVSPVLMYVDDDVITNKECNIAAYRDVLRDSNICIDGAEGKGSCNGDSGGPLTVGGVQVGIVSFGIQYCPEGYPSVFTRVTSYLDWIEQNSDVKISA